MSQQNFYAGSGYQAGYEDGYYSGHYTRKPFLLFILLSALCKMVFSLLVFALTGVWILLKALYGLIQFLLRPRK